MDCIHYWKYIETIREKTFFGDGKEHFRLTDRFYCEKCLETREVNRATTMDVGEKPNWF